MEPQNIGGGNTAPHRPRKVCIVGFSQSTRELAPWHREDMEFWGMNTLWEWLPMAEGKWTRWYDLHGLEAYDRIAGDKRAKQFAWLKETRLPVFMKERYIEFPSSLAYPFAEAEKLFFTDNPLAVRIADSGEERAEHPYFTNSIVWEIIHAIMEGDVGEIYIFGVDMVKDSEWAYQRPNCEYFVGLARGMGIKVAIPERAALCRGLWQYGVEDKLPEYHRETIGYFTDRERELIKMKNKWEFEKDKATANYWAHDGAIQENRTYQEIFRDRSRGAVLWRPKEQVSVNEEKEKPTNNEPRLVPDPTMSAPSFELVINEENLPCPEAKE